MGKKKISNNVLERRKKRSNAIPLVSRNRFEVHINRSKHNIVGKKDKNDRGLPGISRSKANQKRKETLLVKYKQRNKSNVMIDKRFGEFDDGLSAEEKMLKRFTLEKQSHHVKAGHYNIEDDEELTHFGQSIGDISNFNEIEFGSDDDADGGGGFGGFLSKKKNLPLGNQDEPKMLTRKDMMNEIIADSKRDKHERQKTKELAFELTQKLDTEWKEIHSMLIKRGDSDKTKVKEKQDDYDKIVNELIFEAKGKPTERLKSAEEIARIEKQKEEKLVKQRMERMQLLDEDDLVHQSADALIEKKQKEVDERFMLQYRDGEMIKPEGFDDCLDLIGKNGEDDKEEEEEEDGDEDDDSDNEDVFSDEDEVEKTDEEHNDEDTGEVEQLKTDEKVGDSKVSEIKTKKSKKKKGSMKKSECNFDVPESLECLRNTMLSTKSDISSILPEIRQVNISNKKKLEKLVDILFEYIEDICSKPEPPMHYLNKLGGFIQQLVQDVPVYITKTIQSKLGAFLKRIRVCIKQKNYGDILPSLSELTLLKIVELIFPTSDLNHVITTPCMLIIALILTKARFKDIKCIISGVFLLDILYSYVKLSKRYLPELITFLVRLFSHAVPTNFPLKKITSSILNMERNNVGILFINEKQNMEVINSIKVAVLTSSQEIVSLESDSMKLSIIKNMLLLTEKFCNLYKDMETFNEIIEPVLFLLEKIPVENYPLPLIEIHSKLLTQMQSKSTKVKEPLKLQARKPKPLTLLEPQFEEISDNVFKKHSGDKAKNEHDKLKYKVKKEMKGAIREIRKDTQYLAKQQLSEKLQKDATRKRKVQELKSSLENERREIKELEKKSKVK